jgi:cytochrome P450
MSVDLEYFWPLDPALSEDYWPTLARMRNECPVHHSKALDGFWVLTRYEDTWRVARDYDTFISGKGVAAVPFEESRVRPVPAMADPPFHRTLRQVLGPFFTPKRIEQLEPFMRQVANELLDTFVSRGSCEFMHHFSIHLPARIYFEGILGIASEDVSTVRAWADTMMIEPHNSGRAWDEFGAWAQALCDDRRANGPRGDGDVIDALLAARFEGEPLSDYTLQGAIVNLSLGGLETTAMALGTILYRVATMPEVASYLQAPGMTKQKMATAVEEFLRYETSQPSIARVAARDVEIGGHLIREGDRVVLFYGSGNRDSAMFSRADELVLDRPIEENRHMTFGSGIHRCLGSHLALHEIRVALEQIFARITDIELDQEGVRYRNAISRGPETLRLKFKEKAK